MEETKVVKLLVEGPVSMHYIADSIAKHSANASIGAHDIFLGQVRSDVIEGKIVIGIDYTCYAEMAEEKINEIKEAALTRFKLNSVQVQHSIGVVNSGDISLFVLVCAGHRVEAFEACRWIVEEIKANVPIWGKEFFDDETYRWKTNTK